MLISGQRPCPLKLRSSAALPTEVRCMLRLARARPPSQGAFPFWGHLPALQEDPKPQEGRGHETPAGSGPSCPGALTGQAPRGFGKFATTIPPTYMNPLPLHLPHTDRAGLLAFPETAIVNGRERRVQHPGRAQRRRRAASSWADLARRRGHPLLSAVGTHAASLSLPSSAIPTPYSPLSDLLLYPRHCANDPHPTTTQDRDCPVPPTRSAARGHWWHHHCRVPLVLPHASQPAPEFREKPSRGWVAF